MTAGLLIVAGLLRACSSQLDWRELAPPGWSLSFQLPCRPANQSRSVSLVGHQADMVLYACSEAGATFSVGSLMVAEPALVAPTLQALAQAAARNVQGRLQSDEPATVPGMTPGPMSRHQVLIGRLPDGRSVQAHVLLFSHGLRLYQAILLGTGTEAELAHSFLGGLRVKA